MIFFHHFPHLVQVMVVGMKYGMVVGMKLLWFNYMLVDSAQYEVPANNLCFSLKGRLQYSVFVCLRGACLRGAQFRRRDPQQEHVLYDAVARVGQTAPKVLPRHSHSNRWLES